jgi:iron complex outermembrane receptor protein
MTPYFKSRVLARAPRISHAAIRKALFAKTPLALSPLALSLSLALTSLVTLTGTPAFAQSAAPVSKPVAAPNRQLPEVTITGNPLGTTDLIAPAEAYAGDALLLRAQSTLGETLDGTPGVSSSYFGPNASRPIIRGQEGDRIRILQNSGASVDASGLSHDHAVPADPISMERIEVLRGPGALLYGGSAVGGVVNVIDNRIAREPQFDNTGGISGKLHLGLSTGSQERTGAVLLETGTERFALHVDAFDRRSGDVAVPVALDCSKPGAPTRANAICNSSATSRGGAVGAAVFFEQGRIGASLSTYQSNYGTVAEDEVTINMRSDRATVELDLDELPGPFKSLKARITRSDYQHTEFEGAEAGTVFKNAGNDLRLVAQHVDLGPVQGVVGLQLEDTRFSADGEEAFAPYSRTQQSAVFALEELPTAWGRLSLGLRLETVDVESMGNPLVDRFVPGKRSFSPASYALGGLWNVAPGWKLTAHLASSERAPKDYELFADGPHIATHAYEVGNSALGLERSNNLDVGVKWKQGAHSFGVSGFVNQYNNYLSLESIGSRDAESDLPVYAYTQVKARFQGLEASGNVRLLDGAQSLDLGLRADLVRADNASTGQPLPRIAPVRLGASLAWGQSPWSAKLDANHVMAQERMPVGDTSTGSATLLNASLSYHQTWQSANLLWFAKLDNLSDTLAYSASSILTHTAPGKSPLPGRSLKLGVQVKF